MATISKIYIKLIGKDEVIVKGANWCRGGEHFVSFYYRQPAVGVHIILQEYKIGLVEHIRYEYE